MKKNIYYLAQYCDSEKLITPFIMYDQIISLEKKDLFTLLAILCELQRLEDVSENYTKRIINLIKRELFKNQEIKH